jgi:hypothetical protein
MEEMDKNNMQQQQQATKQHAIVAVAAQGKQRYFRSMEITIWNAARPWLILMFELDFFIFFRNLVWFGHSALFEEASKITFIRSLKF